MKLIYKILTITLIAILPSCVMSNIDEGLTALTGKPISTAVQVLGYPDQERRFQNDKIYIWSTSFQGTYTTPETATTTGYIGGTPVYGTTTYNTTQTANYSCLIKIITGTNGLIKNWEYNGNPGGCGSYASRLKAYAKSQEPQQ